MSINIAKKYIDFSNQCLIQYLKLIIGGKVSQANFKKILTTYNNVRYYNYYPMVSSNKSSNLNYYLNKTIYELYPTYSHEKLQGISELVRFVLSLDFIHFDQIEGAVLTATALRTDKTDETEFVSKLTKLLKENMNRKNKYLDSFKTDIFRLHYEKTYNSKVTLVDLDYDIKFPTLYSAFAIKKVYNSGIIDEQKLFIEYTLLAVKTLKEVINNDFGSRYIVDFPYTIFRKKTKKTRLFTLIDSDALKEKIIVKMDSSQFELNQDAVIEMIQAGFKMAIEINANFEFNKSNLKLLEIFEYIIVSHEDASKIEYKNKVIIRR